MDIQNTFGNRLRELRKSKGTKVKDLAKVLYCSPSLIYNIEKGYNEPQPDFVIRVARFFNVTTDILLGVEQQRISASEEDVIKIYRRLDLESKKVIFSLLCILDTRICRDKKAI